MTFEPGVTRASVTVPIINDNVVEEEESFNGRLHSIEPDVSIGEDTAIVTIEDDDGKIDHNCVCVLPSLCCSVHFLRSNHLHCERG